MEETKSLICTRCGSHYLEKQSETEYKCLSCDAIITKEKALDFEEQYKKLQAEGKAFDIANLRSLVRKALEGHIDKDSLIKYSQDILRVLPGDVLSLFYIKFANRIIYPSDYEYYLNLLLKEATQTEIDEIIDIIITNARFREKEQVINIINKFYKGREDKLIELEKALKQRTKEIDLFSDIPRDIFICHSSLDKDKVNEILKTLEEDGNTCWISSRNIPWDSDNYWLNIEKAIKSCNIFLCLNSVNTMQSNDCRREVEIASTLNKKRIEYKLDESRDITLFKQFFTGQWITNINDLLIKVYDLKHKEESEYKNAIKLLLAKDYIKAKEAFENIKGYQDVNEYLDICNSLIKAENLINEKMYNEAKERLISLNSTLRSGDSHTIFSLIKELINKCDDLFTEEEIDNAEINLNMGLFSSAEDIYKRLVVKYKTNYRIWYGYLESVSKNFTSNKNESIRAIYENTIKYVPNSDEKRKLIEKCKSLFMDNTSSNNESIEKNNDEEERKKKEREEELKYEEEIRKKIAEETRKKILADKNKEDEERKKKEREEELKYEEEIRKKIAEETRKKILADKNKEDEERKKKEREEELKYEEEIRKKIAEETRKKLEEEYKTKNSKIICKTCNEYINKLKEGCSEKDLEIDNPNEINELGLCFANGKVVNKDYKRAFELYNLASQKGSSVGTRNVGLYYELGQGVTQNFNKAFEYYTKAYEQGNYLACNDLGRMYRKGLGVQKDEKKSFNWCQLGANNGNKESICDLGYCYEKGIGCKVDKLKALENYEKAGELGSVTAMSNAGLLYEYGTTGIHKNWDKALQWYKKAAAAGHEPSKKKIESANANIKKIVCKTCDEYINKLNSGYSENELSLEDGDAINSLGVCYENGKGVKQDYKKAFELYSLASQKGNSYGTRNVGLYYKLGRYVAQDYKKALEYYLKAYEQGCYLACDSIARLYENGLGVVKDENKAFAWYSKGAEKNNKESLNSLGICYESGKGCKQDYKKALECYEKASKLGLGIAMYNVGIFYEYGKGVLKNKKKALEWYKKSADAGYENAKKKLETLK